MLRILRRHPSLGLLVVRGREAPGQCWYLGLLLAWQVLSYLVGAIGWAMAAAASVVAALAAPTSAFTAAASFAIAAA